MYPHAHTHTLMYTHAEKCGQTDPHTHRDKSKCQQTDREGLDPLERGKQSNRHKWREGEIDKENRRRKRKGENKIK